MILTDDERAHVASLLESKNINGEHLTTSIDTLCAHAGDVRFPEFIAELRSMRRDTVRASIGELAARFGHYAVPAARILQVSQH